MMWILICVIVFLSGVILTIVVVCCLKKRRMKQGPAQNELPLELAHPPPYNAELGATANGVYSVEHTYEKLEKGKCYNEVFQQMIFISSTYV